MYAFVQHLRVTNVNIEMLTIVARSCLCNEEQWTIINSLSHINHQQPPMDKNITSSCLKYCSSKLMNLFLQRCSVALKRKIENAFQTTNRTLNTKVYKKFLLSGFKDEICFHKEWNRKIKCAKRKVKFIGLKMMEKKSH